MDREEEDRLLIALEDWVRRIRRPDDPLVYFQGLDVASSRELVRGVAIYMNGGEGPQAAVGRRYLQDVESVLEEVPFEAFVGSVERSGSPRSRVLRLTLVGGERLLSVLRRLRLPRRERQPPDDHDISSSSGLSV